MSADNGLNLVWALLAVAVLTAFMTAEWRYWRGAALVRRARRGMALVVVLIAIFPTISATDDLVRVQSLNLGFPAPQQVRKQGSATPINSSALWLARLSESLQNVRISCPSQPVAAWRYVPIAGLPKVATRDRFLSSPASRAPPQ